MRSALLGSGGQGQLEPLVTGSAFVVSSCGMRRTRQTTQVHLLICGCLIRSPRCRLLGRDETVVTCDDRRLCPAGCRVRHEHSKGKCVVTFVRSSLRPIRWTCLPFALFVFYPMYPSSFSICFCFFGSIDGARELIEATRGVMGCVLFPSHQR